jgi:hypothetical protein
MAMRPEPLRRALLLGICALAGTPAAQASADLAWREAERARREMQRQQRITECQHRVLARQNSFASSAEFLRSRQACSATR